MTSPQRTRRSLLAAAAATASVAGCTTRRDGTERSEGNDDGGNDQPAEERPDELDGLPSEVALEPVVDGLDSPVAFEDVPARDRQYVVEQPGRIQVLEDGEHLEAPVLDHTDAVEAGGEMGMLGIALHPEFPEDRRAFVRYSAPSRAGTPDDFSHTFVLAEFEVSEDGRTIDPDSERTVLEIPQPQANHNAGDLAFGPDGRLFVPTGDGGGAGDRGRGHPEDWYGAVAGGNGQDVTERLLGGVLRVDVDAEPTEHPRTDTDAPPEAEGEDGYAIPDDNPLVGADGRDEYFAWGLRNPWRVAVDDGRLFVADVGQDDREEVNLVERAGNYGWNVREGTQCYGSGSCPERVEDGVPAPRGGEPLRDPIVEYAQDGPSLNGVSVIGGHVARGDAVPDLRGAYVFGDLQPEGRLFATVPPEDGDRSPATTIDYRGALVTAIYAIDRDAAGELYVLGDGSDGGAVWQVAAA